MNLNTVIKSLYLVITIAFIILALITKDAVNSKLFASIGIIAGVFANKSLSSSNNVKNVK